MSETFANGRVTLYCGDCIEVLATLPAASIDSVVCDPPYHLTTGKKGGTGEASLNLNSPAGRSRISTGGFMGKCWDGGDIAFRPETWAAVLRVMKPGAHLVAFGGTRTYHRMACAIEDAGFEVRDTLAWLYGSGFPKSHDLSKAIDRKRKDNKHWLRVGQWLRSQREARGFKQKEVAVLWPSTTGGLTGCVANWELGFSCPKWDQWLQLKSFIGFGDDMDAEVWRLNGRKGKPGEAWQKAELLAIDRRMNEPSGIVNIGQGKRVEIDRQIKAPNSAAARAWAGFGTALKPAFEPIILARKPLAPGMTVAGNVLAYGTGGINIDGCRVEGQAQSFGNGSERHNGQFGGGGKSSGDRGEWISTKNGRWPANVLHDSSAEVVGLFPETASGSGARNSAKEHGILGAFKGNEKPREFDGDSGSAARFFYTAKADADDRLGSKHPTIKPIDLMQWLVRLVTPPGGTVLDCFAGTGTTGEAAFREGLIAILIEREAEYQADIRRRMSLLLSGKDSRRHEAVRASGKAQDAGPLFAQVEAAE